MLHACKFVFPLLLAVRAATCLAAEGDDAPLDQILVESHAWAPFGKGAWRKVRIVTENFDEAGTLTDSSVTENTTTVEDVAADRVTLRVEATVEVAGQRFPSQPQIITQGYAGEQVGQSVSVKRVPGEEVTVDGREIPCETQQVEILGGATKELKRISFSRQSTPAVLRSHSTTSDASTSVVTQEATSEVVATDLPLRVLDETMSAFLVRNVLKSDRGTTTTWSFHVHDVPGEVVAHSSKKLDDAGRLIRRSTLELVAYGDGDDDSFRGKSRNRGRRRRR